MIEVRKLTTDDLAAFRALHRVGLERDPHAFVESLTEEARRPDGEVAAALQRGEGWGAFVDGALVAKLTIDAPPYAALAHTRWLHGMLAHPDVRGAGAARALMKAAIADAAAHGATCVLLWVNAENARARRFYQSLGFVECGRAPGGIRFAERTMDDMMMALPLTGEA